ncbi:MAG: alpha/beta hydrolase [Phycisphaerales bacterium]|nr:alpha/beta hydrolase [Phycisphaerales bacterium]
MPARPPSIEDRVTHHYADSDGVKIHYVTLGEGPLVVMLHGFPDYWYTWRHQMEALAASHTVAAVDLRGYNLSDKPRGVEQYDMRLLMADVAAVIRDAGSERAVVAGHDWGGAIAWWFAMTRPQMTERLIILNLPHPRGMMREWRENPQQQANSAYARRFQEEGAHETLTAEGLASWVTDEAARARYVEAFERSDFEAMLNYYKRNFPRSTGNASTDADTDTDADTVADADTDADTVAVADADTDTVADTDVVADPGPPPPPPVTMPVLMFHGLEDQALLASGLNDTWEWIDADLTLVTIPGAGHFVQQDAADLVTRTMVAWLNR